MPKRKRKYTPQEEVQLCAEEIIKSIDRFNDILKNGCNDPSWTDGHNMELVRNHVLYFKQKIKTLCEENELSLPPEYTLPTPPEVNLYYMAKTDSDRFKKLNGKAYFNGKLTNQPFVSDAHGYPQASLWGC